MGCHFLLQGIFLTQGSNPSVLHCRQILYQLTYQGSPLYYSTHLLTLSKSLNLERTPGSYLYLEIVAPHSSTFAWKIPWTEEPGGLQSMGSLESDTTERLHFHFSLSCIGEGNGNPLQCSCLENPRDGGAWWAALYEVAQSRTRLKRLSSSSSSSNNIYKG